MTIDDVLRRGTAADVHAHRRRSCRTFCGSSPGGEIHLYEASQLCWSSQGETAEAEPPDEFGHAGGVAKRAAPSGGRLYPLTLYVVATPLVAGISPGGTVKAVQADPSLKAPGFKL